jgi:hypothetical protein
MNIRVFAIFLLTAVPAVAQRSGIVTVYAEGGQFKGLERSVVTGMTGKNDFPSSGQLIDVEEKIAYLTPGRFISFKLPPGKHLLWARANRVFTDIVTRDGPDAKDSIELNVESDKQYFYRLTTTTKGAYVVQVQKSHLTTVSCQDAQAEAGFYKRIDLKKVEQDKRQDVLDSEKFPSCK